MPFLFRRTPVRIRRGAAVAVTVAAAGAATLAVLGALPAARAASRPSADRADATVTAAAAAARGGLTGPKITVANNQEFSGYDLATGPNGTAYLGWIGDNGSGRMVHLCTLPRGAARCAGGIQTIASAPVSLDTSTAAGLRVLVSKSNLVTLIWMHATVASENGPEGDEIAIATSQGGGKLSAEKEDSAGPSFGYFLDAALAPSGSIWALTEPTGAASNTVQVTKGLGTKYQTVTMPYTPGAGQVAFNGDSAVLTIAKAGTITAPVYFDRQTGSGWTAFKPIARTWDVSGWGLADTASGLRLIATENNADYHPVVTRLTSAGWSAPTLTGDVSNCSPSSHDVVSDASGRLADATNSCDSDITVSNLANTRHAAFFRFAVPQTMAGGSPQLTTAPSGRGWVAWSVESTDGNKLFVAPLVLPGVDVTTTASVKGGRVVLTGPASCLPPVGIAVGVAGHPASGWRVASKSLKLDGSPVGSVLHGASLTAGRSYTLAGSVTFAKGSARSTGKTTLAFRTCGRP